MSKGELLNALLALLFLQGELKEEAEVEHTDNSLELHEERRGRDLLYGLPDVLGGGVEAHAPTELARLCCVGVQGDSEREVEDRRPRQTGCDGEAAASSCCF